MNSERTQRLGIATVLLQGMLSSPGVVDRTKVNKKKWARIAFAWTDALLEVEGELWSPIQTKQTPNGR